MHAAWLCPARSTIDTTYVFVCSNPASLRSLRNFFLGIAGGIQVMPEFADQQTQDTDLPARDPLTGAYARGLLREQIERQIERARQHAVSFSLCVFDLDYFKSVNDTYGHTRGDQVLRDLVQRLQTLIRGSDMLFRYG